MFTDSHSKTKEDRMYEPSDRDLAIHDRHFMGLVAFGPLTKEEAEAEANFAQMMEERDADYAAEQAAGGKTICPECGERAVVRNTVLTYGHAAHPEAEYSVLLKCEKCGWTEL